MTYMIVPRPLGIVSNDLHVRHPSSKCSILFCPELGHLSHSTFSLHWRQNNITCFKPQLLTCMSSIHVYKKRFVCELNIAETHQMWWDTRRISTLLRFWSNKVQFSMKRYVLDCIIDTGRYDTRVADLAILVCCRYIPISTWYVSNIEWD